MRSELVGVIIEGTLSFCTVGSAHERAFERVTGLCGIIWVTAVEKERERVVRDALTEGRCEERTFEL